ncbi:MAG: hypothetical protein IJI53_01805 [Clostridia bacterium]|nr:hypothetical protein [Clostridia bacterium]MBR0406747.1 hypothetical protein [Clostridia bacterium]
MNFQGKAVLVYLEEDNIARAYFRVQPLMTQEGPLAEMTAEYPDDGFLRIVPDKNEQHTFKERMRTLSGLCLVDLRFFPMDSNKIRTNKNYSPSRGETNQYIVYSDAVRALPDDLVYQVVAEGDVRNAMTPCVYIRNGANIQGPFRKDNLENKADAAQLPPDSAELHSITLHGQDMLFYWPKPAQEEKAEAAAQPEPEKEAAPQPAPQEKPEKPAPAPTKPVEPEKNAFEQIQSMNEQLGDHANRLRPASSAAPVDFVPEQPAKPLIGTKLYQAPQRQMSPKRAHNPLMEVVENQRYASRFEAGRYEAPGATIPQNTELKEVANPADAFKRALLGMCHSPEAQRQAVDIVLAQSGMRQNLAKALGHETNDLTLAAMHSQLQELEAERLMTLMQLDDAKKNLSAAREQALGSLNMVEQKKLDQLHIAQQTAQNALDQLNKTIAPLEKRREEAAAYVDAVRGYEDGGKRVLCPAVGGTATKAELINRVEESMKAAGFLMEDGDALAMLTAFALSAKNNVWQIRSEAPADADTALDAFAAALGVQVVRTGLHDDFVIVPGGNTPVFISANYETISHPLVFTTFIDKLAKPEKDAEAWQTPHCDVPVYTDPDALPKSLPVFPPVSLDCVIKEMLVDGALTEETTATLLAVRKAIAATGCPLPLETVRMMARFIAAAQNEFKGGVAEAIDRAFCLYVVAHILDCGLDAESVKAELAAMPRTLKALKA